MAINILIIIVALCLIHFGLKMVDSYDWESFGIGMILIGAISFLIIIVAWPSNYMDSLSFIARYKSTKSTISELRQNNNLNELAALNIQIIKTNSSLAQRQYYANKFFFENFYPEEIKHLEPLK